MYVFVKLINLIFKIQQKEKLLQNSFQLLQCMVADPFPRETVAVPKIAEVVPLFKPTQQPQTKTVLAEDLVKKQKPSLSVEKLSQNIFGKKLGVAVTLRNISKWVVGCLMTDFSQQRNFYRECFSGGRSLQIGDYIKWRRNSGSSTIPPHNLRIV